jgi:hypothetical protein
VRTDYAALLFRCWQPLSGSDPAAEHKQKEAEDQKVYEVIENRSAEAPVVKYF